MFERFTDLARKVVALASQEAQRNWSQYIGTEHILLGILKLEGCAAAKVLMGLYVDLRNVRFEVEKLVKSEPETGTLDKLPQTPRAKRVIVRTIEEARNLNHNYVGTEHLLLGLCGVPDGTHAEVLRNLGVSLEQVRSDVLSALGLDPPGD